MPDTAARRVLIVDDNRDSTETLSLLLGVKGHTTRVAADGEEAIAIAEEFRPEIVLLDLSLPKLDGYEVARRLRERPYGAKVLLVAVTGWSGQDVKNKAAEAGFDYHLLKPFEWEHLDKLLEQISKSAASR